MKKNTVCGVAVGSLSGCAGWGVFTADAYRARDVVYVRGGEGTKWGIVLPGSGTGFVHWIKLS